MIFHMAHEADPQPFSGTRREGAVCHSPNAAFLPMPAASGPNGTSMRMWGASAPHLLTLSMGIERGTLQASGASGPQMRIEAMIAAFAHSTTALLMMHGEGKACDM